MKKCDIDNARNFSACMSVTSRTFVCPFKARNWAHIILGVSKNCLGDLDSVKKVLDVILNSSIALKRSVRYGQPGGPSNSLPHWVACHARKQGVVRGGGGELPFAWWDFILFCNFKNFFILFLVQNCFYLY